MSDYNTPNMNDFNQPLSEEITPPKKSSLIVYYVVLTFSLILVLIGLTSTIIIGAVGFAILVITFPYTIKTYIDIKKIQLNKKIPSTKKKIFAFIFLLYCVFVIGSFTSFFDCYFKFPYDLQKAYIKNKSPNIDISWFPENLPESITLYKASFSPSILQATGDFHIRFKCDKETVENLEKELKKKAEYSFILKQAEGGRYSINEIDPVTKEEKYVGREITIRYESAFWKDTIHTAFVYVLDTNLDWNHPQNSYVIIDSINNKIEFVQIG